RRPRLAAALQKSEKQPGHCRLAVRLLLLPCFSHRLVIGAQTCVVLVVVGVRVAHTQNVSTWVDGVTSGMVGCNPWRLKTNQRSRTATSCPTTSRKTRRTTGRTVTRTRPATRSTAT